MSEQSAQTDEGDRTLTETIAEMQQRITTLEQRLAQTEQTLTQRIIDLERDLNRRIRQSVSQSFRH